MKVEASLSREREIETETEIGESQEGSGDSYRPNKEPKVDSRGVIDLTDE
jgi:hypothetical protein